MTSHDLILSILETRYDYYSARVVLTEALQLANLSVKKSYGPEEIGVLSGALKKVGDRVDSVVAKLMELQSASGEMPTAPTAEETPAPEEKPKETEAEKKPKKK